MPSSFRFAPALFLVASTVLACSGRSAEAIDDSAAAVSARSHASACRTSDHCAFLASFGAATCGAVTACRETSAGAGCHGSAVASPSDAQFCETAASQPNPQQACSIWGPSFNCVWTEGAEECVSRQDGSLGSASACSASDHCSFFGDLGQCDAVPACKTQVNGAGCHGGPGASDEDARFCERAVSQPDPHQACGIWGPSFHCVWTEGETACVPRQSQGGGDRCSVADHCAFYGELGRCDAITACKTAVAGAGCHGGPGASASDARFCESAVSQPDPHQACGIWGPSFHCVWTEGETSCLAKNGPSTLGNANACGLAEHCAFLGDLGECSAAPSCTTAVTGAGCHGSAVASPSDAQFCETAASQPNPQQACSIWGPSFNCVWTEGSTGCVPR